MTPMHASTARTLATKAAIQNDLVRAKVVGDILARELAAIEESASQGHTFKSLDLGYNNRYVKIEDKEICVTRLKDLGYKISRKWDLGAYYFNIEW